jgi:ERCC4-type nuclease
MSTPILTVLVDSREQRIPPMPPGVAVERATLHEGDYTLPSLVGIAVVERKSAADFVSSITHGRERFDREIERLKPYKFKAIVVEDDLTWCYRCTLAHRNSILGTIASYTARHDTPVLFAGDIDGAGRLICGLLRRWNERIEAEKAGAS